jgi:hypothetical protein
MTRLTRSLLCTTLLLCAAPLAPAGIVHVPINQTVAGGYGSYLDGDGFTIWTSAPDSYDLDVNADGLTDLTFESYGYTSTGFPTGFATDVIPKNGAAVAASDHGNVSYPYRWWSTPLLPSDAIGPNLTLAPANTIAQLFSNTYISNGDQGDDAWLSPPDNYLPFQFDIAGQPHFGWVRLSVDFHIEPWPGPGTNSYGRINLYDAAYETNPNTPIPEPACLTLGGGAAALLLRRRRA